MENIEGAPPADHLAAVADAEAARDRLVGGMSLPSFFHVSIGAAVALQIALAAVGIADQHVLGVAIAAGGVVLFVAVGVIQLARFRRLNGVWLGGLLSRVVMGTATAASVTYALALAAAVWAAFASAWWLVTLASLAGGVAYAVSGRRWWRTYRGDPVTHARAESGVQVAALAALAVAGGVLLVVGR